MDNINNLKTEKSIWKKDAYSKVFYDSYIAIRKSIGILGIIFFWSFTKHSNESSKKRKSYDKWYKLLGYLILSCAIIYLVVAVCFTGAVKFYPWLIAEVIGLEAMGLTWLLKGNK